MHAPAHRLLLSSVTAPSPCLWEGGCPDHLSASVLCLESGPRNEAAMPLLGSEGSHLAQNQTHSPYGGAHRLFGVRPPVTSLLASCQPLPSLRPSPLPSLPQGLRSGMSLCPRTLFRIGTCSLLHLLKGPLPSVVPFPVCVLKIIASPNTPLSLLLAYVTPVALIPTEKGPHFTY